MGGTIAGIEGKSEVSSVEKEKIWTDDGDL